MGKDVWAAAAGQPFCLRLWAHSYMLEPRRREMGRMFQMRLSTHSTRHRGPAGVPLEGSAPGSARRPRGTLRPGNSLGPARSVGAPSFISL